MNRLLNRSLKMFIIYAGLVLAVSIPAYYWAISLLWQYEMNEHNIILTPEAGREDKFLIIGAVTLLTILFFMLLLGILIWVNRRVSRRLWQPFYKSIRNIKDFDLHAHQPVVFAPTDIVEFAELNESLHKLISGNIAAYRQQKEFADNASHELQTPLAIVQSKLELLLQDKTQNDAQYAIIEEALQALSRVSRINKNLLLLTKIENSQYREKEIIDLSWLLDHTLALFSHFSDDKQITVSTNICAGITVEGNKILVEILLNNLLTNAIRYSPSQSTLSVSLEKTGMAISNAGTAALNREQLFKRFGTASPATPGTGLGLALVQQICARYNWDVRYGFDNGQHIFSVRF